MSEFHASEVSSRTFRDLIDVVFRHKKGALLFFIMVVAATVIVLAFTPATYTASSSLIMRIGRENLLADSTTFTGALLPFHKEWSSEMNTELEILRSRELVEDVVTMLGPSKFLTAPDFGRGGKLALVRRALSPITHVIAKGMKRLHEMGSETPGGELSHLDQAIKEVERNLETRVQEKSDVIEVSYTSTRPELAQQFVTLLIDRYLEKRIDVRRAHGAYQFFAEQKQQLMVELQRAESAVNAIKNDAGISSLEDSQRALQKSIEMVRDQQLQDESALAAGNARVETLRRMLSQQAQTDSSAQRGALLDRTDYQALQATLRNEEIAQIALVAGVGELKQQRDALRKELAAINALEPSLRKLEREQVMLEEKYRKYSENQEQARINQALEMEKISNVSVVQRAVLPVEPDKSASKLFKLIAAMFLGLMGGFVIAFLADSLDPSLYSEADIADRTGLATLIEIPLLSGKERDPAYQPPLLTARKARPILHSAEPVVSDGVSCFQELYFKFISMRPLHIKGPLVIGLTGSVGSEGVSTVAGRLAAAFSEDDRFSNVFLLDANLTEHSSRLMRQRTDLPFTFHAVLNDEDGSLEMPPPSLVLEDLTQARQKGYDVIVVDIPPVEEGNYALRIAAETDFAALVVSCGSTPWRAVKRSVDRLQNAGVDLCGVLLNRQRHATPKWLYRKL